MYGVLAVHGQCAPSSGLHLLLRMERLWLISFVFQAVIITHVYVWIACIGQAVGPRSDHQSKSVVHAAISIHFYVWVVAWSAQIVWLTQQPARTFMYGLVAAHCQCVLSSDTASVLQAACPIRFYVWSGCGSLPLCSKQ